MSEKGGIQVTLFFYVHFLTYPMQTEKEFTEGRKGGDGKDQKTTGNSSQINF